MTVTPSDTMGDIVITGASRGIGRALALAIEPRPPTRLVLVARDEAMLKQVASQIEATGGCALSMRGDLAALESARELGERLAAEVRPPVTLVHNAGIWPARRELTADGLERAFVVNYVGPLLMQQVLLTRRLLDRVMLVSAGLLVRGRYSAERTPGGLDFSSWRTYCTTKLACAIAQRDIAARYPTVDFVVLHPGVARTDLGARRGLTGALLHLVKRLWERPEVCGARLRDLLARDRWSPPGTARWLVEDQEQPWPSVTEDEQMRHAVRGTTDRFLSLLAPSRTPTLER